MGMVVIVSDCHPSSAIVLNGPCGWMHFRCTLDAPSMWFRRVVDVDWIAVQCGLVDALLSPGQGEQPVAARPHRQGRASGEEGGQHKTEQKHRKPHGTRMIPKGIRFSILMFIEKATSVV